MVVRLDLDVAMLGTSNSESAKELLALANAFPDTKPISSGDVISDCSAFPICTLAKVFAPSRSNGSPQDVLTKLCASDKVRGLSAYIDNVQLVCSHRPGSVVQSGWAERRGGIEVQPVASAPVQSNASSHPL